MEKEPSQESNQEKIEALLKQAEEKGLLLEIMNEPEKELSEEASTILIKLNSLGWKAEWEK